MKYKKLCVNCDIGNIVSVEWMGTRNSSKDQFVNLLNIEVGYEVPNGFILPTGGWHGYGFINRPTCRRPAISRTSFYGRKKPWNTVAVELFEINIVGYQ